MDSKFKKRIQLQKKYELFRGFNFKLAENNHV